MDRRLTSLCLLAVLLASLCACTRGTGAAETTVAGLVTAGPTCPVVTVSPDPSCADRPVADAAIVVQDAGGREVARITSDPEGAFAVELPPGAYRFVPQPVSGLLGTAPPMEVRVAVGEPITGLVVSYDTGIR
jgi:hypothetical protein